MGTFSYIKNFLKDPKVASVTPTSRFTVQKICGYINFKKDLKIVEYGPADGVFTKELLRKCSTGSSIVTIETNSEFIEDLRKINDDRLVIVNQSAEHTGEIMASMGWSKVDYILSGIPFSFLKENIKHNILKQSADLLNGEGVFLGYQTSSHLKAHLNKYFSSVETEMEYRNIPPMCIYIAKK